MHAAGGERGRLGPRTLAWDGVDAGCAALRGHHVERLSVARPCRSRHQLLVGGVAVRPAAAASLEFVAQAFWPGVLGISRKNIQFVVADGAQFLRAEEGDGLPVGRPGGRAARERAIGQAIELARLPLLDGERVEVEAGQPPPIFAPTGSEGDARAIGRPGRVAVVIVATGQLLWLSRLLGCSTVWLVDGEQEEMMPSVVNEAHAVEFIEKP